VTVPPEWLDRLLGVLLDNACKYSPKGGAISVSVGGEGRRVRLTVDDSGPGIPPEQRSRVFDRFHRATDTPGGGPSAPPLPAGRAYRSAGRAPSPGIGSRAPTSRAPTSRAPTRRAPTSRAR
jgi:hypothetical protein